MKRARGGGVGVFDSVNDWRHTPDWARSVRSMEFKNLQTRRQTSAAGACRDPLMRELLRRQTDEGVVAYCRGIDNLSVRRQVLNVLRWDYGGSREGRAMPLLGAEAAAASVGAERSGWRYAPVEDVVEALVRFGYPRETAVARMTPAPWTGRRRDPVRRKAERARAKARKENEKREGGGR